MRPVHVGLLVVGAALAGGLAVKMTELPTLPPTPPAKAAPPAPVREAIAAKTPATPIPVRPAVNEEPSAAAPPAIYEEAPRPPAPPVAHRKPVIQVAKATAPSMSPAPYQPPANPAPPPAPAAPAPTQAPAPPVTVSTPEPEAPLPPPPPRQVTLQAGMTIPIRLMQTLSTDRLVAGDTFQATLAAPLIVDGLIIAERGAGVSGRVLEVQRAGRLSGASRLQLALSSVQTADGQKVAISTEPWSKQGGSARRGNAEKIAGGAAIGAIIGAIAGGGAGAAIGAGVGGGAGIGAAAATGAKPVSIPTETVIRFRLNSGVTITERQL